ncbi:Glycosyltransferase, GT2 family [Pseudooceanicola antarcticus]|nr:glycosyltransferase [Pseudooceanicola antarcticus]SNY53986.1 Glycosyltransferase, GT2 family [Pseudooceanicola antarcticus]
MNTENDPGGLHAQAQARLDAGEPEAAYALLQKAVARTGETFGLCHSMAEAAFARGWASAAEHWWRRAIELAAEDDPRHSERLAEAHLGLGTVLYRQEKLGGAVASYRRTLALKPDHEGAAISLAIAFLATDCPALALEQACSLLERMPEASELRLVRARALIQLERPQEALADLTWLHEREIKLGEVGLLECEVHRLNHEHETALVLAAELCEALPDSAAPLRLFRSVFAEFMDKAPAPRVAEFLDGLALPRPQVRKRPETRPDAGADTGAETGPIDVIIPVHNGREVLRDCLKSIEAARSPLMGKLILVDDGSSRGTRAWLRAYQLRHPRTRLLRTRGPLGFTRALQAGLSASKAPRFVALNSDTLVGEGWLEQLSAAMPPDSGIAMAGPLSNAAAWQSLGQVFDASGNFASHDLPEGDELTLLRRRLRLLKTFDASEAVLVHGFCALVDRKIHDELGGLDDTLFPEGYGEFQDLSLRALDAGYGLRIAEDCLVAHARGASLNPERRAKLSRAARRALYERYTALRYLSAECSAVLSPQLVFTRRRMEVLNRRLPELPKRCDQPARMQLSGQTSPELAGRKVCLFVSYAPDGRLLPYTRHYLEQLRKAGFLCLLIMNTDAPLEPPPEAQALAEVVIMRRNQGLDFGAWRDALARFPELWQAEMLLFTNDSILGPFDGFTQMLQRIEESPAPVFYLTDSEDAEPHFQSFFWGLRGAALQDPAIRGFLASIEDLEDKSACIFLYEVFLRHVCEKLAGLEAHCLFPMSSLSGVDSLIRPSFNPTHHLWRELLDAGFPFLKADFCRKNATGEDAEMWLRAIADHGGDPMRARLHVEESRLLRARA